MKIYNTLSKRLETIQAYDPPKLGFYACGFTVYDYAHLGHLRRYTMDDVLLRTLKKAGYQTKFVQNVTDVGHLASDADTGQDKMEKGAKKYQTTVYDLAQKFENYFYDSMDQMGNLRPDVSCRATEHIREELELVKELEEKGYAYEIENEGIYFDTSQVEDYGKLARLASVELKEGARVKKTKGKRNPSDFALWKFERAGENRAMNWPSPWAEKSFPGWHIECSALSMEYLGPKFEIHTGGIDHIPVHHTNEIAQSEAATDQKPFVKYWVHHNHLLVGGEKMSKSLNNFYTIDDVKERGYHPRALRLLFLSGHYRSEMNFTWESLAGAQASYEKLLFLMIEIQKETGLKLKDDLVELKTSFSEDQLEQLEDYRQRFFTALENDLGTPEALSVLWSVVKSKLSSSVKQYLLLEFDQVLALGLGKAQKFQAELGIKELDIDDLPVKIRDLIQERQKARSAQSWSEADQLRLKIEEAGYSLEDLATGEVKIYEKTGG